MLVDWQKRSERGGTDSFLEFSLETLVVGGDAGRIGIPVAFEGLDAAESKQESPCGYDIIVADAKCPCDLRRVHQLPRGEDIDAVAPSP